MSKAMRISFKIHGNDADMVRQLHQHLRNGGIYVSLDNIVKRQFLNWAWSHVTGETGDSNGNTEAVQVEADTSGDQPQVQSALPGDALLESPQGS